MGCTANLANCVAYDPRERLYNVHCQADALHQSSIIIAIFVESFLSFLE